MTTCVRIPSFHTRHTLHVDFQMSHDFRAHDHTGGVADVQLTPYRSPANALVAFHCANVSFTARSYVSQCIMYPVQHCPASTQCMARSRCATPAWSCRAHASPEYHPSLVYHPSRCATAAWSCGAHASARRTPRTGSPRCASAGTAATRCRCTRASRSSATRRATDGSSDGSWKAVGSWVDVCLCHSGCVQ